MYIWSQNVQLFMVDLVMGSVYCHRSSLSCIDCSTHTLQWACLHTLCEAGRLGYLTGPISQQYTFCLIWHSDSAYKGGVRGQEGTEASVLNALQRSSRLSAPVRIWPCSQPLRGCGTDVFLLSAPSSGLYLNVVLKRGCSLDFRETECVCIW